MANSSITYDISLLHELGQDISSAPSVEVLVENLHRGLCRLAPAKETRVVALEGPNHWKEWIAGSETAGVRIHREPPAPRSRGITEFFDERNREAGFLWVAGRDGSLAEVLRVIAPHVHTAVLLHTASRRTWDLNSRKRRFSKASLDARDDERRRIARELHDDLGQSLASVRLTLKWVEKLVTRAAGMDEALKELASTRETIGVVLGKIRDVSHTLYPSVLDTLGLPAAIRELSLSSTRHSDIEALCAQRGTPVVLPKEISLALYRSCQESLSNAVRHSEASRIVVTLAYYSAGVHITVEDNGKGFDPGLLHPSGGCIMSSGFGTIRQRMIELGGAFRVSTAKGQGTVVEVIVPTKVIREQCKAAR